MEKPTKFEDLKGKNLKSFLNLMEELTLKTISDKEEYEVFDKMLQKMFCKVKLNKGEELYLFNLIELISFYDEMHENI